MLTREIAQWIDLVEGYANAANNSEAKAHLVEARALLDCEKYTQAREEASKAFRLLNLLSFS